MSYTCVSCRLSFDEASGQRDHMKSEWHRYNLKRRVAQLPSIDEDTFNSKIAAMSINDEGSETKPQKKHITKKQAKKLHRESLQKQKEDLLQSSEQTLSTLNESEVDASKEPKEKQIDAADNTATIDEEKLIAEKIANKVDIAPTTCLFCPEKKKAHFLTVDENISHMFKAHGLYIPERTYLVDKEGLLSYLGEKIGFGNVCLVCSYQGRNLEAVREHMHTKRHMKIPYEVEDEKLEISDFYDFTSTYDSLPSGSKDEEDGEWEDVSGEEDAGDSDDSDFEAPDGIVDLGTELLLPTGAVVGHRSMARYYRQHLPPDRILSEGQGTVIAAETRHFLSIKDRQELSLQKRAWSREKKREDVNDRRAQKFINNQPHFRDPLLQ